VLESDDTAPGPLPEIAQVADAIIFEMAVIGFRRWWLHIRCTDKGEVFVKPIPAPKAK
jgi:hypothetical protein